MGNNTQYLVQSESIHIGLIYAVIFQSKVQVDIRMQPLVEESQLNLKQEV